MLSWFKTKTVQKVSDTEWATLIAKIEYLQKLDEENFDKLKTLVNVILNKPFVTKSAKKIDRDEMLVCITQAGILILNLGEQWLSSWKTINQNKNDNGKCQINKISNFGATYIPALSTMLDEMNGERNGVPPLHSGINELDWTRIFNDAMLDFRARVTSGPKNEILFDLCAADNLAGFFAIMTEVFFIAPDTIRCAYPDVYQQLVLYYRQNTAIKQNMNTNNAYKSLFTK